MSTDRPIQPSPGAHDMVCTAKQSDVTLPMGIAMFHLFHPQLGED
jgi:hypothetical protein